MLTGDAIWILKIPWPNGFLHLFLRTPSQPRSWYSRTWSFAFGLLLRAHVAFQFCSRSTGHTTFLCKHNPKKPGRFPIPGVSCWFPGGLLSALWACFSSFEGTHCQSFCREAKHCKLLCPPFWWKSPPKFFVDILFQVGFRKTTGKAVHTLSLSQATSMLPRRGESCCRSEANGSIPLVRAGVTKTHCLRNLKQTLECFRSVTHSDHSEQHGLNKGT